MSCGLLTGAISIGRQMLFPDEIRRALLHNSPAVSAWCAVTVEGDRNRDLGSPRLRCVHSCQGDSLSLLLPYSASEMCPYELYRLVTQSTSVKRKLQATDRKGHLSVLAFQRSSSTSVLFKSDGCVSGAACFGAEDPCYNDERIRHLRYPVATLGFWIWM